MRKRIINFFLITALIMTLFIQPAFAETPYFIDEFEVETLSEGWEWINEDPDTWSLTAHTGYMMLSPRFGDIYETSSDAKNILLREAPDNWVIETKAEFTIRPATNYQQGAIIAMQDLDNYIKLDWEASTWNDAGSVIQVCREVDGTPTADNIAGTIVGEDNTIWFRLEKEGSTYRSYYSIDGEEYVQLGSDYTLDFENVRVGLIAINGGADTSDSEDLDVKFDYFKISELTPPEVDKTALIGLIEEAQSLEELDYTTETWAVFQTALDGAIAQNESTSATQEDVDGALTALQAAINGLEASQPAEGLDFEELIAAIEEAEDLLENAVIGVENGKYMQTYVDSFAAAIDSAKAVYASPDSEQVDVDTAKEGLDGSIADFTASVITSSTGDLDGSNSINVGDLAMVAYYYNMDSDSANWEEAKIADINNDGSVGLFDLSFVAYRMRISD